jgi:polyvinyl alcohol dehydrogenase (cytochrome)
VRRTLASAALLAGVLLGGAIAAAAQGGPPAAPIAQIAPVGPGEPAAPETAAPAAFQVANPCPEPAPAISVGTAQWNGWGRDPDNSRYQPEPALRASDAPKLRLKWAYGYHGASENGQPTVIDGRVFAATSTGRIYALDARSGCTYWTYAAAAATHGGIVVGALAAPKLLTVVRKLKLKPSKNAHIDVDKPPCAVFFGDDAGAVYALDARNGQLIWKIQADAPPRARVTEAPALFHDRLYVPVSAREEPGGTSPGNACCTARGSVVALDVATGRLIWKAIMPAAGFAVGSTPTIDVRRDVLYVTTGAAAADGAQNVADAVVALSLGEGTIRWVRKLGSAAPRSFTPRSDADRAPILRALSLSSQILVVTDASGVVFGLDPERSGEPLWQSRLDVAGQSAVQWGAAVDHRSVYAQFAREAPGEGAAPGHGLVALDLKTGKSRWAVPSPDTGCGDSAQSCRDWQSQAVTVIPGIAFSGSADGHLQAHSTIDGRIVWEFATARPYTTVNALPAQGGAIAYGGVAIVGGIVYVNSGDALLAFSVDGK